MDDRLKPSDRMTRAAATIRRGSARLQRRLRVEAAHDGLSPGRLSLLGHLYRRAPMTPGELAAADGLKPQSVTRLVAGLEADGLVTRTTDPADARRQRLELTEAGVTTLTVDARGRDDWLARAMVLELSPVERRVLVLAADLMERLADLPRPVPAGVEPAAAAAPSPLPARAVPILPTHDSALTTAFYERLGFSRGRGSDDGYVMLERDNLELHFQLVDDVDPFRTAGVAYLSVPDADAFRAEIVGAGVAPVFDADDAALRRRWAAQRDLSRVGPVEDKPWRVREFALADPTNNLLRVGHPIGLKRRRTERQAATLAAATPAPGGQES
jgi:DNA-binding MarR family transcriptional regulator